MVKKLLLVHCRFCNNSFQTFDNKKFHCNDSCITKDCIISDRMAWEEKKGLEGINPEEGDKFTRCLHCGKYFLGLRKGSKKWYKYCDYICQKARTTINKMNKDFNTCSECGKSFIPSHQNKNKCSDACRYASRRKKDVKERDEKRASLEPRVKKELIKISYEELNRRSEKKRLEEEWKKIR